MTQGDVKERVFALEKDFKRLEKRLERLVLKLDKQGGQFKSLAKEMKVRQKREEVLMTALGIEPKSKVGERGLIEDMDDSILRLEDYLLAMGERVQRILAMLQGHRDVLDRVNESVVSKGQRDRMKLELDIMMNSISILTMAGIEIDPSIPAELDELRKSVRDTREGLEGLKRRKRELDKRLEGEIKKYNLEELFARRRQIPGYG